MEDKRIKKIMIFGRPGSGKSTFASKLSDKTGLPLYHLDKYFFVSNWAERDTKEFMRIQKEMVACDEWIIDGNSTKSLETRWSQADLVLYFNYGKVSCLICLIKRRFTKPFLVDDRAPNSPEVLSMRLIKYMWTFEKRVEDTISELRSKYWAAKFIEINSDKDLNKVKAIL